METKRGRERRYDIAPLDGFRSPQVAYAAAALDELRERVYDQVIHLPQQALDYVPGQTQLSVGRLMLHLGWAELGWIRRLSGRAVPVDLDRAVEAGALAGFKGAPPPAAPAGSLVTLCRRVRDEVTLPYLRGVADFDEKRLDDGSTVRGVVTHLCWHWVYHSGHIGLLSFEAGHDYEWVIKRPLA
jgi:uncharacterized damage-inducible protein DinB